MKQRYEGLLVLDVEGKEEGIAEMIERLKTALGEEGAEVEQVQKMDKRRFSYAAGRLASGYFVNFVFQAEPAAIARVRARLKFDPDVYRQHYQKAPVSKRSRARETENATSAAD